MPAPSLYSRHPSIRLIEHWEANLKERTGRSLAEWLALLREEGPATEKEQREWLASRHGLPTNTCWWLAERAGRGAADDYAPEAYVEEMFRDKPAIRPLYDKLLKIALKLGPDVKACPCQTIVPLYRQHVFAQLKPAAKQRLDLGLALGDELFTDRLLDTGGRARKDRLTHRVAITRAEDIDDEVRAWLRQAYDLDAPGAKKPRRAAAEVTVPEDVRAALAGAPAARAAFEKLPPSHRREHIEAIDEAKKPETRQRRIRRMLERLGQG
jgi:hypothetical protein